MQKSTRASALGSLAVSDIKGCVFLGTCDILCVHVSSPCVGSVSFQAKKKGILNVNGRQNSYFDTYFLRKSGIELTGPDKSYFLWAPSKEAIEVCQSSPCFHREFLLFLRLLSGFS